MAIEMDCCVLSNLMLLLLNSNTPLNDNDNDVIQFISEVISKDLYTTQTFIIAPEYPKKAVILYHLARLITTFPQYFKHNVIQKLHNDIKSMFKSTQSQFEKIILQTSLMRFDDAEHFNLLDINNSEVANYWWFTAGFLSSYPFKLITQIAPISLFHLRFKSKLLNLTLVLENRILVQQYQNKNK